MGISISESGRVSSLAAEAFRIGFSGIIFLLQAARQTKSSRQGNFFNTDIAINLGH
jgi:hypothetical protein